MPEIEIANLSSPSLIRVGPDRERVWDWLGGRKCLLVSDETVYGLYTVFFKGQDTFLMPPGEASKNPDTLIRLLGAMAKNGLDRDSCLVAVGGGVVSDLAVLAAGLYMRGIRAAVISSTLLGQVDASVGGKCAVNLLGVKNLVGLFKQPELVICDTGMLATLPEREWRSGLGELVKHALLQGPGVCEEMMNHLSGINERDVGVMTDFIADSVRFKAAVVGSDEKEKGLRRILNLGHSFGHVYEAHCELPHGEAVALGLVMALRYSRDLGLLDKVEYGQAMGLIMALGLAHDPADIAAEQILFYLGLDKKKQQRDINLVLLAGLGHPQLKSVPIEEVARVWPALCLRC